MQTREDTTRDEHSQVKSLESIALQNIRQARTPEELELLRVKYLGRKGDLTAILRSLGKLDPEERRHVGQEANRAKEALEAALDEALGALKAAARRAATPAVDVTLPGRRLPRGRLHPLEPNHGGGLRHLPPPGL